MNFPKHRYQMDAVWKIEPAEIQFTHIATINIIVITEIAKISREECFAPPSRAQRVRFSSVIYRTA